MSDVIGAVFLASASAVVAAVIVVRVVQLVRQAWAAHQFVRAVREMTVAVSKASDAEDERAWRHEQAREARILEGEDLSMPYERGTSKERR